jgi:hypothetical protein
MAYNLTAASSQYLSTASAPASGSPMTIAGWIRPSSFSNGVLCSVGVSGATHRNQLQTLSGSQLQLAVVGSGGLITVPGGSYSANTWGHLSAVLTSSTSRTLYFNGSSIATNGQNIGTQNAATSILVGARDAAGISNFFPGQIAEVGIWSAALTAAEIASLAKGMTCDKIRPQSLVFYAPLVRDLNDAKGGLTITNNNGATVANHPRVYA